MEGLLSVLTYIQITLAVLLTGAILLQQRGAGLGSAFGGGDGTVHYERRGSEKTLFQATIIITILFILSVMLPVLIKDVEYTPIQNNSTTTSEVTVVNTETKNTEPTNTLGIPIDITVENSDKTTTE